MILCSDANDMTPCLFYMIDKYLFSRNIIIIQLSVCDSILLQSYTKPTLTSSSDLKISLLAMDFLTIIFISFVYIMNSMEIATFWQN